MIEEIQNWPSLPVFEMELNAVQLRSGYEIRVHGDLYGLMDGDVTVSVLLHGTPAVIYPIASVPLSHVEQMADGHPVVLGEGSAHRSGGLRFAPIFPGLPIAPMRLYEIPLSERGECRVQAQEYRIEDGFAFFSVECATSGKLVSYDLVSIPTAIIRRNPANGFDIQ